MDSTITSSPKLCVACGKNVAGRKRMKDSAGRYWCIECGKADQAKKVAMGLAGAGGGTTCGGCGENFSASQLTKWGNASLCNKCIAKRSKGPGLVESLKSMLSFGGGGQAQASGGFDFKKYAMIGGVIAVMAAIAIYVNFFAK